MNRKSLLTWAITLPLLSFFFMLMYPALFKEMESFIKVLESFPIEFRNAFGLSGDSFNNILGFYSFILTYILVAGGVQAMNLGVSSLSMEVRDKTCDFLYSKPVSRIKIMYSKVLCILAQIIITNIAFYLISFITLSSINSSMGLNSLDLKQFFFLTFSLFMIQVFFACIGLFVSAFLKRIRTVLPVSLGIVFFFYIIFVLNQTLKLESLSFMSPFGYFELSNIIKNSSYELKYIIGMLIVCALSLVFAEFTYAKKDMPSI